ncbi:MAG: acyl-CoA dehydrogenase family protein, partial [Sphingobium sp.]
MDFDSPSDNDPRRLEVRAWFDANPNPSLKQIAEAGYAAPHWPRPWGLSANPELQIIISDEAYRAGVTMPNVINAIGVNQCGQTLVNHGTPEQQARYLPPALACEELWTMLFSEPSGGSDLSAARTVARREGDHYIINGQKIWSSAAHKAHIGVLLARTDPSVPKHRGLSVFLIDMKAPGVEVRRIADMSGYQSEFNEVFLDEVRVPATALVGNEGEGWGLVLSQLQTERMGMTEPGAVWGFGPTARELVHGLIKTGKIKDSLIRDEAAALYVEGEMLRLITCRNLSNRIGGKPAGLEGNLGKMVAAPHGQRMADLAKRAVGAPGMLGGENDLPLPDEFVDPRFNTWDYSYWFSPAGTLGVGTQEILKNSV